MSTYWKINVVHSPVTLPNTDISPNSSSSLVILSLLYTQDTSPTLLFSLADILPIKSCPKIIKYGE